MKVIVQLHTGAQTTVHGVTSWRTNAGVLELFVDNELTMAYPPGQWAGAVRVNEGAPA